MNFSAAYLQFEFAVSDLSVARVVGHFHHLLTLHPEDVEVAACLPKMALHEVVMLWFDLSTNEEPYHQVWFT
jgi:hypothetical protein